MDDIKILRKINQTQPEYTNALIRCINIINESRDAEIKYDKLCQLNLKKALYVLSAIKTSTEVNHNHEKYIETWEKYHRISVLNGFDSNHDVCFNFVMKKVNFQDMDFMQSNFKNSVFYESNFTKSNFSYANLESVNFSYSNLESVNFKRANLKYANLSNANLKGANFSNADLEGAYLSYSDLDSANFSYANLKDATFVMCAVDNRTMFKGNINHFVNRNTDFSGVSLSSTRINPTLQTYLECNIRKKHWKKWYATHNKFLSIPMRIFWFMSNYGTTATPALITLVIVNILSFLVYTIHSCNLGMTNSVSNMIQQYISCLFSPAESCLFTLIQIGVLSVINYLLLAVLITRFSIMFQTKSN